ncbi:MAG: TIGR00730 family Rossman fold protein [Myxococcota bacterium]
MRRIAVYCGVSSGGPALLAAAERVGVVLAERGIGVVYGGAGVGMMGAVADGALRAGGDVTGVIPELFGHALTHPGLTEVVRTTTMAERKQRMFDLSDGIIALPGGLGTLEELVEVLTWARLGFHRKPIGILDVDGYFTAFLAFLDDMQRHGFCGEADRDRLLVADTIEDLLLRMAHYQPVMVDRPWLRG